MWVCGVAGGIRDSHLNLYPLTTPCTEHYTQKWQEEEEEVMVVSAGLPLNCCLWMHNNTFGHDNTADQYETETAQNPRVPNADYVHDCDDDVEGDTAAAVEEPECWEIAELLRCFGKFRN